MSLILSRTVTVCRTASSLFLRSYSRVSEPCSCRQYMQRQNIGIYALSKGIPNCSINPLLQRKPFLYSTESTSVVDEVEVADGEKSPSTIEERDYMEIEKDIAAVQRDVRDLYLQGHYHDALNEAKTGYSVVMDLYGN